MYPIASSTANPATVIVVDIGTIDPRERRSMVFDTFARLAPGHVLELVSDHNPQPLLEEFFAEVQGGFWWDSEKRPLGLWRVLIGKPVAVIDLPQ